ncbi:MAG TPA: sulfatase [Thermoguttaceae bacterium]|nr:sulfatase [Thermoguttaceae bacterium]
MKTIISGLSLLAVLLVVDGRVAAAKQQQTRPNILFLLTDQWRADATGYAGDPNVQTPNLDRLASQSVNFTYAVSGCPVCCPYRASLMTGQRVLTHGVFMNDVQLSPDAVTIAEVLADKGYDTGYVGKWHIDGRGRSSFIPRERRQGFEYWKVLECTHNYNNSFYWGDEPVKQKWDGYDTIAQTADVEQYLRGRAGNDKPFLFVLSWGTPHAPYLTAPQKYRDLYDPEKLVLRPNVPEAMHKQVRRDLAGYYAHCTAIDEMVGRLLQTLKETGLAENTIVVFTADHGDMLGSQGAYKKQRPFDESIRVPLLFHAPSLLGQGGRTLDARINTEDLMPTLLGLCGVDPPASVEGLDYSQYIRGGKSPGDGAAVVTCVQPFGQWTRRQGGRECRGLRTDRYTYVRSLDGPWLLFDNEKDPYQMTNVCNLPEYAEVQARLDKQLMAKLTQQGDEFLPGPVYLERWGYKVDAGGTVPYTN